ncbi:ABC transporter permease subunit [Robertmurraya korlensis]|uniref:ABC transporter permease subunit n=1 Tax=Robertmurraya korlensis TaxID=519977 RepID=UPI00203E681D|nr:ABC transporter permease subunit [Robertmurraya korlensis]MCM3601323.1 ABC transporter permease subunit [Robertmurraya korlensis]
MVNRIWREKLIPWMIPMTILGLWQILSMNGMIPATILPSPIEVIQSGEELTASGELINHISISLGRALTGFLIGGLLGFLFGLFNGLFKPLDLLLDTSIQMLRNIPHLALLPLVILWFGIDEVSKVFLVALGVLFPIYINTYHGIKSVDKGLIEMGRAYGLKEYSLFFQVILPGALSSILVGIRYALGIMWTTLIVAETIGANSGVGYMAMNAREFMQMDVIVLSILIYSLLGKLSDWIAKLFEKKWLMWKQLS